MEFNQNYNGFNVFQSYDESNAVQVYIWPEDAQSGTGIAVTPTSHEQLIQGGGCFGLRALFDCVASLQGSEDWWWELSRRCRLQNAHGPVPKEEQCSLNWQTGKTGYCKAGEKASSPAFETWFNAVRHQIALNMYKMGIIGSGADAFLDKIRLCYAKREPYYFNSVYAEVQGVPVIYLGDSAGSTDFKQAMSCGRGLICAADLVLRTLEAAKRQEQSTGGCNIREAFRWGAQQYQRLWNSAEMKSQWGLGLVHATMNSSAAVLPRAGMPACAAALAMPHLGTHAGSLLQQLSMVKVS
jgi:hypothetical protein